MITVGVDAGTYSYRIVALDEDVVFYREIPTEYVRKDPSKVIGILEDIQPDAIAGPSAYGLPVKRFSELTDEDVAVMTLNFGRSLMGLRKLIDLLRRNELGEITWTIPGISQLPTIPRHRRLNKIDLGTSDKLCSVALAMKEFRLKNFILVEAGFGFNAFVGVKDGRIVDAMGGTTGFPSFSSMGALDGELAYLMGTVPKSALFMGGVSSLLKDMGIDARFDDLPELAIRWLSEFLLKGVSVMEVSVGKCDIVVSGRFFDLYYDEFSKFSGLDVLRLHGRSSAEGGAVLANGLVGGKYEWIVESLRIRDAEAPLSNLTSDIRSLLSLPSLL